MVREFIVRRGLGVAFAMLSLATAKDGLAQSADSPAQRCNWEGWLPPSAGRERIRQSAHLDHQQIVALVERSRSNDKNTRLLAAERLGAAQDDASLKELVALTDDPNPMVQEAAIRALGRAGEITATPIAERLATSSNSHLRQGAVWTLGQLQDPRAENTLIFASRDTSKHIRAEATWALGLIGGERAAVRLRELALDSNPQVRLAVVCSLERIHQVDDAATLSVLSALTRDSVTLVREAARWAQKRLGATP